MEFYDLIRTRESIRNYDPQKTLPGEVLEKILDAGRLAPSAANYQPWKFKVISSPAMLEKVRACYSRSWFHEAPLILIVTGYRDKAWKRGFDGYNSIETDLAIAMTHLILAAENEGVATCWIAHFDPALLRKTLELKDNEEVFSMTPLGYPKEDFRKLMKKNRKTQEEIVEFL